MSKRAFLPPRSHVAAETARHSTALKERLEIERFSDSREKQSISDSIWNVTVPIPDCSFRQSGN